VYVYTWSSYIFYLSFVWQHKMQCQRDERYALTNEQENKQTNKNK